MKKLSAIEMLNKCIEELQNMSKEEINNVIESKKIREIKYNFNDYIGAGFNIILKDYDMSTKNTYRFEDKCKYESNKKFIYTSKSKFSNDFSKLKEVA